MKIVKAIAELIGCLLSIAFLIAAIVGMIGIAIIMLGIICAVAIVGFAIVALLILSPLLLFIFVLGG